MILFENHTLQVVALGTAMLGSTCGALGTFAVLRRQSLLGDAVSHAALPGIAIAFLLTHRKSPFILALGASLAGWLGMLAVLAIIRRTRIPFDAALGIILSVFFGFGVVLLSVLQRMPDAAQAGLERFYLGQAATLLKSDLTLLATMSGIAVSVLLLLWKEFKLLAFDPDYSATLGYPTRLFDILLTSLLVLAVVLGLQCVGVVLTSSLLIAPGVAARQWSNQLGKVVLLAALFGAISGIGGTLASDSLSRPGQPVPTGPAIVLVASAIVFVSFFARAIRAPRRKLIRTP